MLRKRGASSLARNQARSICATNRLEIIGFDTVNTLVDTMQAQTMLASTGEYLCSTMKNIARPLSLGPQV